MAIIQRALALGAALVICAGSASAQAVATKKGATLHAKIDQALDSKKNKDGDPFTMTPVDTLFDHHPELKGAVIEGHLENVSAAGPTHKASMSMIFDDVKYPDGNVVPAKLKLENMSMEEPKTHHVRDVGIIVGSAVAGKMVSDKTGHKGGTLAGAAAGFAIASSMKSDIRIKRGTSVKIKATDELMDAPAAK